MKTMEDVYRERADAFMLAMALAKLAGLEVGVRGSEDPDWPVHVIYLPEIGEVAIHMAQEDTLPAVLEHKSSLEYDGHTDEDKSLRIRQFVEKTFSRD
jgi:hypothetical protein